MRHIYRQVTSLERYRTVVLTQKRQCAEEYPFSPLVELPKPKKNFAVRFWQKYVIKAPAIVYRGELRLLADALERHQARMMHIYFGHTGVHLLPFIQAWDKPVIVSFHGMDIQTRADQPGYMDKLQEMVRGLPLVLARSHSLLERLEDLGCPKEKLRLNRTGIPLELYPLTPREFPSDGKWRLVQACRLIAKKGIPTTFKAFAGFRQKYPQATLTLAGEGPLLEELRTLAAQMGLAEAVNFAGFLDQRQLYELYAASHIFLHPSEITPDSNQEGVPNSMLEAMATGLPVVATLHGGIPEAVEHAKTGFLLPERDAEGIQAALEQLAASPALWALMGAAASASIRENFEHTRQIAKLEDCYQEVLAARR
jgi:colanic acid/amylovoran biosynthesis glycosyltransferase